MSAFDDVSALYTDAIAKLKYDGFGINEARAQIRTSLAPYVPIIHAKAGNPGLGMLEKLIGDLLDSVYGPQFCSPSDVVRFLSSQHITRSLGPVLWFGVGEWTLPRTSSIDVAHGSVAYIRPSFSIDSEEALSVQRTRRVMPRLLAKYGMRQYPFAFVTDALFFDHSGKLIERYEMGTGSGSSVAESQWYTNRGRKELNTEHVHFLASYSIGSSKIWKADVSLGGATVRLLIGPHEAKEIFALRDIPESKNRRAALLHIVRTHSRARPYSRDDTVSVRRHLRGSERCTWDGCSVSIHAPQLEYGEQP